MGLNYQRLDQSSTSKLDKLSFAQKKEADRQIRLFHFYAVVPLFNENSVMPYHALVAGFVCEFSSILRTGMIRTNSTAAQLSSEIEQRANKSGRTSS